MAAKQDYYEVLGVPRDAGADAIKDAFRQLALKYHPDRNKEAGAEDRFKEIAEAYAVLSDPKKRADYDSGGFAGISGFTPEDLLGGIDFESIFSDLGFGLGFGESIFDRIYGRRRGGRGADIEIGVSVPIETIVSGGEEQVRFSRATTCATCNGSGAKPGTSPRTCDTCKGTGQKTTSRHDQGVFIQQSTLCPDCHGQGKFIDDPCQSCVATGKTEREESLTVKIPVGAEDGMALRIPGKGYPAATPGGASGDLLVVVRTVPDPRFVRDGADLWRSQQVNVVDAVLGTEIDVPSLDGPISVKIPSGTQPDSQLRLRGKGLPRFGARGRGDLYLRIDVKVPERLTREQRRLFEQLRAAARPRNKT
ncbi:MAG: molecular chaperone DnaJ [Betaproteobacteria bacterium]|nr:MAG: molecular chaperone DnaJ [Betaproteobacteria bacterium]